MSNILACIIGYGFGALPFGYWTAKKNGVDIFKVGSGNPGATNITRTLGKRYGVLVFLLDAFKGWLAVWLGLRLQAPYSGLFGALIGHSYSCWTHFKGGKGVASLIGGLLRLMPLPVLSGLLLWLFCFKKLRYVSCASILFVISLLPLCCLFYGFAAARSHAPALLLLILWTLFQHRANLQRLWNGQEHRF